jgi:hypothetical protein
VHEEFLDAVPTSRAQTCIVLTSIVDRYPEGFLPPSGATTCARRNGPPTAVLYRAQPAWVAHPSVVGRPPLRAEVKSTDRN